VPRFRRNAGCFARTAPETRSREFPSASTYTTYINEIEALAPSPRKLRARAYILRHLATAHELGPRGPRAAANQEENEEEDRLAEQQ
jgi:hypothetical protein